MECSADHELLKEVSEGVWRYPVVERAYDEDYFKKYREYEKTELGRRINEFRSFFVDKFWTGPILDIGIGSGHFMKAHGMARTRGWDVNLTATRWLQLHNALRDPYSSPFVPAFSFWDSLEHIANPTKILELPTSWIFVSIPIFKDMKHVFSSRHFRPDEHYWYFTEDGFSSFLRARNWEVIGASEVESQLGREDIKTFAARRISTQIEL